MTALRNAEPHVRSDGFWLGRLSASIGEASKRLPDAHPKDVRADLRATLTEFIASPVPSEELREILRSYLK